jgi:erythromycin esterase-like protein
VIGSLYETFAPEEARRIRNKLEIHYTPKHGSATFASYAGALPPWLNMAETEINVLVNSGLSRRIPTMEQMHKEVEAWNRQRNEKADKINWRFTTEDARVKLRRLYPLYQ